MLLDTHFLLWTLVGSPRLASYPWMKDRVPWLVSPASLLEIQFLAEVGKLEADSTALASTIASDPRFTIDDLSLVVLVRHAIGVEWTRDPFDRLLIAHSLARRAEFCSVDRLVLAHHRYLPVQLRA